MPALCRQNNKSLEAAINVVWLDRITRLWHNQAMRLYHLNFILIIGTTAAVLGAGIILSRKEIDERVPVDRSFVRECAMELNNELVRLDNIYHNDLLQLTALGAAATNAPKRKELKDAGSFLAGVCRYDFFFKNSGIAPEYIIIDSPAGIISPEVVLQSSDNYIVFPNDIALNREQLFPKSGKPEQNEGWVLPRNGRFAVFWSRLTENTVLAFLLDMQKIGRAASDYLKPKIAVWYAPIRAGGGLHRLEGPGGAFLAGIERVPKREPDFIVPMPTHIGTWQILSWDTHKPRVVYDPVRLAVSGTLSVILFAFGLILFLQQRRAQKTAAQRVSFVNRVSHELGTPLTNMLLNLELGMEAMQEQPKAVRHRFNLVAEETRRLARLVRNVLTFSRRERGKLKINPVSCVPDEVIDDVLCQFEPSLARAGIAVERRLSTSETIICDADALAQIVSNLVSNVEKYAATGKWLCVESFLHGSLLTIRVADKGPGIPLQGRERMFHPFERIANAIHNGATGAGLGLAIARDLARMMGGNLIVIDADKGAVFELKVPVNK